jgi:hypothetical protein
MEFVFLTSLAVSPQPSPSAVRSPPAPVENTTQNLTKLAQRESTENLSELEDDKTSDLLSSAGSTNGSSSIRSSPADVKASPSLVRNSSMEDVAKVTSPIHPQSVSASALPAHVTPSDVKPLRHSEPAVKQSAEVSPAGKGLQHKSENDKALLDPRLFESSTTPELENKVSLCGSWFFLAYSCLQLEKRLSADLLAMTNPISLVVNSVEGDKLSMTLTAVRIGPDGLIEKKTNFFFDVSEDHVAEDAKGLVLANQPDFDLDLNAVRKDEMFVLLLLLKDKTKGHETVW